MKKTITLFSFLIFGLLTLAQSPDVHDNLLLNPNGSNNLTGWDIDMAGGNGWDTSYNANNGAVFFVNSHGICVKSQTIDLLSYYNATTLDTEPIITYSEYYRGYENGSSEADDYFLNIYLYDENMIEITSYKSGTITTSAEWQQLQGYISNYGAGLRYIKYEHGGNGNNGWAGYYGSMINNSYITVGNPILYNSGNNTNSLAGWDIDANGGSGWNVSTTGWGSMYQTSYESCTKSQTFDMLAMGYTETELDNQPRIMGGEFVHGYAGGGDTADIYNQKVELMDKNMNVVYTYDSTVTCIDDWIYVGFTIEKYGEGIRYVKFSHGGVDADFWVGHYGALMDRSSLRFGDATKEQTNSVKTDRISSNLNVYPNPAYNSINIKSTGNQFSANSQVSILDIQGRIMLTHNFSHSQTIDISSLTFGSYFIRIEDKAEGTITTSRFTKN